MENRIYRPRVYLSGEGDCDHNDHVEGNVKLWYTSMLFINNSFINNLLINNSKFKEQNLYSLYL